MGLLPSGVIDAKHLLARRLLGAGGLLSHVRGLGLSWKSGCARGCKRRAGLLSVGFLVAHALGVAPARPQLQKLLLQPVERLVRGHRDVAIGGDADQGMIPGIHGDFHLVQKSLLRQHHVRFLLAAPLQDLRKLLQLGFQLGALPRRELLRLSCIADFHRDLAGLRGEASGANPALVSGRDFHVFSVLGHGSPGHVDALALQPRRDLLVG